MRYREWVERVLDVSAAAARAEPDGSDRVSTSGVLRDAGLPDMAWENQRPTGEYMALLSAKEELTSFGYESGESEHYMLLTREARLEGGDVVRRIGASSMTTRLEPEEYQFLAALCELGERQEEGFASSEWTGSAEVFKHVGWAWDGRRAVRLAQDLEHLGLLQNRIYGGPSVDVRATYYGFARVEAGVTRVASVFISYSHADKVAARWIGAELKLLGMRVWTDDGDIGIGDSLLEKISAAIEEMDFLLALITPASVESEWCKQELRQAMTEQLDERRIKVLPVKYPGIAVPAFLKGLKYQEMTGETLDLVIAHLASVIARHLDSR